MASISLSEKVKSEIWSIEGIMAKILILEDNPKLSKFYFDLLLAAGYKVITTNNSKEFFRTYPSFKPDLLILDIKLNNSELSGLEVFEWYKTSLEFKNSRRKS